MKIFFLEYTFKISPRHKLTKVTLGEYSLVIHKGEEEEKIAYANVVSVRMDMSAHSEYKVYLDVDAYGQIVIPNWTFNDQGKKEIQSAGYLLFVRVLHHQLKDKSQAAFKCGKDGSWIWLWAGIGTTLSLAISFLLDYLGIGLKNFYMQSLIFSSGALMLILVFSIKKLPKAYNPSNIPLQFLP